MRNNKKQEQITLVLQHLLRYLHEDRSDELISKFELLETIYQLNSYNKERYCKAIDEQLLDLASYALAWGLNDNRTQTLFQSLKERLLPF
jgi:hypothetical protein